MIMNVLSVSLIRFKLVISSRAINKCLFQKLRQELVEGGGTDLCFMGKQIIMRLYESSYAVPARPSGRVSWKEVKVM